MFNDALALPPGRRRAHIERVCAGHPALIAETLALLQLAEEEPSLLEPRVSPPERLGSCRLVRICGRGAMGVVYEAVDEELDRRVALKILPDHLAADPQGIERFQREAKLLGALNHPGIAVIHRLQSSDGIHFFTMEFVEGRTLQEVLADGSPPLRTTIDLMLQLADALDQAHRRGIVHRDLKPANLMVTPAGRLKVLDFGIARAMDVARVEPADPAGAVRGWSTLRGTPEYMSPEQLVGAEVDHRADIWAFGCLLYECLTGRCATGEIQKLGAQDRRGGLRLPFPRRVPVPLRRTVERCLETDPATRPNSIAELRPVLKSADRSGSPGRWWAVLATGALAVMAIAAALFLRNDAPVVAIQVLDHRAVCGLDERGGSRWVTRFPEDIFRAADLDSLQMSRFGVVEDGVPVGAVVLTGALGPSTATTLNYLDTRNGRVLWSRVADWQTPISGRAHPMYRWCIVKPWPGPPRHIIIAGMTDGVWYPSCIRVLSLDGEILGEYYHPGRMWLWEVLDLDGDGRPSLLVYGDNSSARFDRSIVPFETDSHCGAVALLDPMNLSGQAFPYSEGLPEPRDWPGMTRAQEESYVLFPPLHPDVQGLVNLLSLSGPPDSPTIDAGCADGRFFGLGLDLRPRECRLASASEAAAILKEGPDSLTAFWTHAGNTETVRVPIVR